MVKMKKSENIMSIKRKENKIYNSIKRGKSSKRIGDCRSSITVLKKEGKQYIEKKRGLIFITHLPEGYNEKKVKHYFKNIGKITNVRVYKSKIYDDPERFGYVEFEHPEVAKIAAEKINNDYSFTGNIKAQYISYEKQPKNIFRLRSNNRNFEGNVSRAKVEGKDALSIKSTTADNGKVKKKPRRNVKCRQHLAVQCNLIPMDICEQIIKEIKQESESLTKHVQFGSSTQSKEQFSIGKYSTEQLLSKGTLSPLSKKSVNKSLADIKSNRAILSKSLDSVKNVLEKSSTNSQDEETQTPEHQYKVKQERTKKNSNNYNGRILRKFKCLRNKMTLNSITIKRIARELIRKRGYPLINLKSNQKQDSVKHKK